MQDVTRSDAPVDESPGALRWAVASTLGSVGGAIEVGTGFASGGDGDDGGRRVVRINGINTRSQSALSEILAVVWLVPDMDRLFMDSAGRRRRFLDRLVAAFDPAHTTRLNEYEQAMRERTRLLRDDRAGFRAADAGWIAALEQRMAESGIAVAAARRDFVNRLGAACKHTAGPFPAAGITLVGDAEGWLDHGAALGEDRFRAALADSRTADREIGRALTGPHRSDIQVVHLAKNCPLPFVRPVSKKRCSSASCWRMPG